MDRVAVPLLRALEHELRDDVDAREVQPAEPRQRALGTHRERLDGVARRLLPSGDDRRDDGQRVGGADVVAALAHQSSACDSVRNRS